ncbi:MAG: carboxypeptidase-like regulatory domain-containing protein, partial [Bacteroidota bacterium]
MHILLKSLFFTLAVLPGLARAQTSYVGVVLDKNTEKPIPRATVSLVKQRLATETNDKGYFSLKTNTADQKDTLVFTCVGYQAYRIAVAAYRQASAIKLLAVNTYLNQVSISHTKRSKTLEAFSDRDIYPDEFITFAAPTFHIYNDDSPFIKMDAFAKLFEAPETGTAIHNVQLGRGIDRKLFFYTEPAAATKFKLHIITVNALTGAPDSTICTKEVSLQDIKRRAIISFSPGEAIIKSTKFFIAIEWLKTPYNEFFEDLSGLLSTTDGPKNAIVKDGYLRMLYQPLLIGYKKNKKISIR